MRLLPFPSYEERQALTPYHAVSETELEHKCSFSSCTSAAVGYVEVTVEAGTAVVGPISIPVCQTHYERHYKNVEG